MHVYLVGITIVHYAIRQGCGGSCTPPSKAHTLVGSGTPLPLEGSMKSDLQRGGVPSKMTLLQPPSTTPYSNSIAAFN